MLRLYFTRYIGCAAALLAGCWLFDMPIGPALLGWAALLALLYAAVKPLYSLIALALDVFLLGLGTLCLDALMIRIALPYEFSFLQALAIAAAVMICFSPYERWRTLRR